jgi:hypothetical protein
VPHKQQVLHDKGDEKLSSAASTAAGPPSPCPGRCLYSSIHSRLCKRDKQGRYAAVHGSVSKTYLLPAQAAVLVAAKWHRRIVAAVRKGVLRWLADNMWQASSSRISADVARHALLLNVAT